MEHINAVATRHSDGTCATAGLPYTFLLDKLSVSLHSNTAT